MRHCIISFTYSLFFLSVMWSSAQEDGLYPPPPPQSSAFVRLINLSQHSFIPSLDFLNDNDINLLHQQITDYYVVPEGSYTLTNQSTKQVVDFHAGEFYTLVYLDDTEIVRKVTDVFNMQHSKALLSIHNLSDLESIDLRTSDGDIAILTSVSPYQSLSREVNAVTVELGVFTHGGDRLEFVEEIDLKRGTTYNVIVMGYEGDYKIVLDVPSISSYP